MFKKTKIICTQGPATDGEDIIEQLILNGMNCARFNFSHGTHEEHKKRIDAVKAAAKKTDRVISLILDTKGPEMRLGTFANGEVQLVAGNKFVLTQSDDAGDETHVSVSHKLLYTEVKAGDKLLLSDGLVELMVDEIVGKDIHTTILNSGKMSTRKRVAAPGVALGLPAISEQDEKDIVFGIENHMDFVAASFIQRAADVEEIRKLIARHGGQMEIIPKIENLAGVQNIDDIIAVSDGIMVARGDLGVEIPAEDVPIIQKQIIKKCNAAGKPVIVATQMLESMTVNPRPTRAEVSDVGNAIWDGADVIMLSGETASGKYPVEATATMCKIAERVENAIEYESIFMNQGIGKKFSQTDAISHATVQLAYELNAAAIITPTKSGYTTRSVSKYRPQAPIIAFTPNQMLARHLNLRRGVVAIPNVPILEQDELVDYAKKNAVERGIVKEGDVVVMTSGIKYGMGGTSAIQMLTI
ncbi:MAG: pyruvate kinase [Selenomonadaceae bacterium]|nr:pyruvate kinase [Selenomonadaceae bacterium]